MSRCPYGMPRSAAAIAAFHDRWHEEEHGFSSPCWQWTGSITCYGYAQFHADGLQCRALRFSYTHFVGEIPDGLTIDHLCRNRACVNPAHLEAVTLAENTRRAMAARTECKHGHPWIAANIFTESDGRRYCVLCRTERLKRKALARNARYTPKPRAARTHCLRGHEFTPDNIYIMQGHRLCRICRNRSQKRYDAKRREVAA